MMSDNRRAKSEPNRKRMKFKFNHNLRIVTILAFISAVTLFAAAPSSAQLGNDPEKTEFINGHEAVAGEVLVKFRNSATQESLDQVWQAADADVIERVGGAGVYLIHSRSKDTATLVKELSARPDILYAEPNYIFYPTNLPDDPLFPQLWGLQNTGQIIGGVPGTPGADISAVPAWDISTGSRANVVGVVDTGIDYTHPDLAGNVWSAPAEFTVNLGGPPITCPQGTRGFNAITNTCDPRDDNNHGTHVSGTIGADGNNGVGVVGVNWAASIMGLKFLSAGGGGTTANAIKAIEFAIQAKEAFAETGGANVRVLNNSWGGGGFSQALLDEINRANTNDMLFVAAAGNNNRNNDAVPFYPASYNASNVLAVAATTNRDLRSSFSNWGRNTVHLGAPGSSVLSTIRNNGYAFFNGTSMASPHVAGAAALVLSVCSLDTASLKSNLTDNVDLIDSMRDITITGGRLNVNRAILACRPGGGFTLTASPSTVGAGEPVTVTWTAPNGRPETDWVALYRVGDSNFDYIVWEYTGGATSGSFTISAPSEAGQYEFRYLLEDGFTSVTASNVVTVN